MITDTEILWSLMRRYPTTYVWCVFVLTVVLMLSAEG